MANSKPEDTDGAATEFDNDLDFESLTATSDPEGNKDCENQMADSNSEDTGVAATEYDNDVDCESLKVESASKGET